MHLHRSAPLWFSLVAALSVLGTLSSSQQTTPIDFTDLPESDYVEVNLINPMPTAAKLKRPCKYRESEGTPKRMELVECDITFWTEAARYDLVGLDMINKSAGKILRTTKFDNPFIDPQQGAWHEANNRKFYLSNGDRSTFTKAARGMELRANLSRWGQEPEIALEYVLCQAYVKLGGDQFCIRENSIYVCPFKRGDLPTIQAGCHYEGYSLHEVFHGSFIDSPSTYTTAVTAGVISQPNTNSTEFDLILFDDTGRMSVSQWNLNRANESLKFLNPETGKKVKIFHLDSVSNSLIRLNDARTRGPKDLLDKWVLNSYLMDNQLDNTRKFTTIGFGRKVRRSHIQAIALNIRYLNNFTQNASDIFDFPFGSLCFASGYWGLIPEHFISCDMPRSEAKNMRSVHALNFDISPLREKIRHVVFQDIEGKFTYTRCELKPGTRSEFFRCTATRVVTPPNDILTYRNGACERTLALYDWLYTVHIPGSDLYRTPPLGVGFLNDQLPFYIMGAMAVNNTFYFFTRANVLFVYKDVIMENCQVLSFNSHRRAFYAEDLLVPNNFRGIRNDVRPIPEQELKDYRPRLIEYREFVKGAADANPSFALELSSAEAISVSKKTDSGGTNLAAIIIALLLGLIILAGIIYIYCLRSSVDEDLRMNQKSPKSSKRPPQTTESLHMPTVRSGMDKQASTVKPIKSVVKSTQSTKKTTRSPLGSQKSKKSLASTKSLKSMAKSRSHSPRSPGTAAKSLVANKRAK